MRRSRHNSFLAQLVVGVTSLILIGIGATAIYWPAGPLAVGFLLWLDLLIGSKD